LTRFRALFLIAATALAALALAACGGDDGGGDEDPQEVLEATFNNDQQVDSGVIDLTFDLSAEGEQPGEMSATLTGPFQDQEGAFSQFDIDAEVSFESEEQGSFSGSGGLVSTGDRAFVNFQGTDYEVPQQAFQQFAQTFTQLQQQNEEQAERTEGTQQLIDSFGELSNEGTEDVDGTETTHISGDLDIAKFTDSIRTQLDEQQGAEGVTPAQLEQLQSSLDQLTESVKSASMDVYSGTDDDILRKLDLSFEVESGEGDTLTADFSLSLSDVNQPQEIAGPGSARPLTELLQQFNIDPGSLGQLGTALGGASAGAPQAGGSATPPTSDATQAYLECLQTATTSEALQECSSLIQ
jgi:hypothetical protein